MAEWIEPAPPTTSTKRTSSASIMPAAPSRSTARPTTSIFATDGLCTHEKVHLADGLVMDDIIECPKHNGRFNYKTGRGQGRAGLRQPQDLSGQGRSRPRHDRARTDGRHHERNAARHGHHRRRRMRRARRLRAARGGLCRPGHADRRRARICPTSARRCRRMRSRPRRPASGRLPRPTASRRQVSA